MIKTPFNWVGNKYKHITVINNIISNKHYDTVHDLFMGSGNLIFNISAQANTYIGNDKIKLLPMIYQTLKNKRYTYDLKDIEDILNQFNKFSQKEDYYIFRDYWNKKYLSNTFDRAFIMETILLLKMCSNSMVRFNPKQGYFNQGFRGLGKKTEFFTETMKQLCLQGISDLISHVNQKKYEFTNLDFIEYVDTYNNNLLILDPPYILRKDMYDTDWSNEHDKKLISLISDTPNDFIYFNYIERDGIMNKDLVEFIKTHHLNYIEINNKTLAGQGRNSNIKEVKEIIITNIN